MSEWANRRMGDDPTRPAAQPPSRPTKGWGTAIALTLIAAALSVVNPGLLMFVPLALALLALPPRRPGLILMGGLLLLLAVVGSNGDTLWWVGRGWALLLGACFVLAVALRPERPFIDHALLAVLGASCVAALLLLITRTGWTNLDATVSQRLHESANTASAQWAQLIKAEASQNDVASTMSRAADLQAMLFPALLALGSICGLAVAWFAWRRLTVREPQPLNRLREFRFRDELI